MDKNNGVAIIGVGLRLLQNNNNNKYINNIKELLENNNCNIENEIKEIKSINSESISSEIKEFDYSLFVRLDQGKDKMSERQVLLLKCVWESIENANMDPTNLQGTKTPIYVGSDQHEPGMPDSIRISQAFNLKGECLTNHGDGSIVASLKFGYKSIFFGDSKIAIIAGSNKNKNGEIEQVGAFILKDLEEAIADNDNIFCSVRDANELSDLEISKSNKSGMKISESVGIISMIKSFLKFENISSSKLVFNTIVYGPYHSPSFIFSKQFENNNNNNNNNNKSIYNNNVSREEELLSSSPSTPSSVSSVSSSLSSSIIDKDEKQDYLIPFSANSNNSLKKVQSIIIDDINNEFESTIPFKDFVKHQINSRSTKLQSKSIIMASNWKELKNNQINRYSNNNNKPQNKNKESVNVFVFCGQGPQYITMMDDLYNNEMVFKKSADSIDEKLIKYLGFSPLKKLKSMIDSKSMNESTISQPLLFIFTVSFFKLYNHWGIKPSIVVGHCIGEVFAAYCSGIFDLETACLLVSQRAINQDRTNGLGKMLSLSIGKNEYESIIPNGKYENVEFSCFNSPNSIVIGGPEEQLIEISKTLLDKGVSSVMLGSQTSCHTSSQSKTKDALSNLNFEFQQPNIITFSTVTTHPFDESTTQFDSKYLFNNILLPVYFDETISNIYKHIELNQLGSNVTFFEMAPHPSLSNYLKEMIPISSKYFNDGNSVSVYSPCHKKKNSYQEFQKTLIELYFNGFNIDFNCQFNNINDKNNNNNDDNNNNNNNNNRNDKSYKRNSSKLPLYQWCEPEESLLNEDNDDDNSKTFEQLFFKKASEFLKLNQSLIDKDQRLIKYGADSLTIVQIKNWVDRHLKIKNLVTIQQLQNNSINDSIKLIEQKYQEFLEGKFVSKSEMTKEERKQFWDNEMKLDESIQPLKIIKEDDKRVFITGATGFLGAHMLVHLLKLSNCSVTYCLLRNKSNSPNPIDEIINNLKHHKVYNQLNEMQLSKIVPVVGDLAKVRLGLSDKDYSLIANNANLIINSGADLNLESDYKSNKPVNVDGIIEIIKLSISDQINGIQKPIVNFSTFTVFLNQSLNGKEFDESILPSLDNIDNLPAGYMQSKVVGEYLLIEAAKRGIPSMLIRPPSIFSHPETGVGLSSDFFQLSVQCCYATGYYPDVEMKVLLTPVDWVSDNTMNLILTEKCWDASNQGKLNIYNVYGDITAPKDIYGPMNEIYGCKPIAFEKWRQMILDSNVLSCVKFRSFHSMDFHEKHNLDKGFNLSKRTKNLLKSMGSYTEDWKVNKKMITSHINYIFNSSN
ncbi:hypothetical protein ACTA71_008080 [Dictyostelium dimigraforme]